MMKEKGQQNTGNIGNLGSENDIQKSPPEESKEFIPRDTFQNQYRYQGMEQEQGGNQTFDFKNSKVEVASMISMKSIG